jgi:hypothetical protein
MKTIHIVKTEGFLSITGGIGLIIWWSLMPVFLPTAEAADNFKNLILDENWVPINLIGLISTILLTLGFPGFYIHLHNRFNKAGFAGLMIASTGLLLFTCIQYYETIIWPAAAQINPELLQVQGNLVSGDTTVVAGLIISGAILALGYVIFGIASLSIRAYPRVPLWFLIIGAPLFGNGVLFPIRTVGLLLFSLGTIWLAISILRRQLSNY